MNNKLIVRKILVLYYIIFCISLIDIIIKFYRNNDQIKIISLSLKDKLSYILNIYFVTKEVNNHIVIDNNNNNNNNNTNINTYYNSYTNTKTIVRVNPKKYILYTSKYNSINNISSYYFENICNDLYKISIIQKEQIKRLIFYYKNLLIIKIFISYNHILLIIILIRICYNYSKDIL